MGDCKSKLPTLKGMSKKRQHSHLKVNVKRDGHSRFYQRKAVLLGGRWRQSSHFVGTQEGKVSSQYKQVPLLDDAVQNESTKHGRASLANI